MWHKPGARSQVPVISSDLHAIGNEFVNCLAFQVLLTNTNWHLQHMGDTYVVSILCELHSTVCITEPAIHRAVPHAEHMLLHVALVTPLAYNTVRT